MKLPTYKFIALLAAVAQRYPTYTSASLLARAIAIYERPKETLESLTPEEHAEYVRILRKLEQIDQLELWSNG